MFNVYKMMVRTLTLPITIMLLLSFAYGAYLAFTRAYKGYSIRVGILHSQTGVMAISELSVIDATLLAIEEINQQGGLLGKFIEPFIEDGASDWPTFAAQAEKLIVEKNVDVIFGCWTSASRKAVKPVIEKYDHLLFYPVQYEGIEDSPNIIYTGSVPNQQILPGVTWCLYNLGTKFYLVGSDYIFPRTANEIIKNYFKTFNAEIVGEAYVSLTADNPAPFVKIIEDIITKQPHVIINTINGSSNDIFFKELRNAGITSDKIPTMSFSIAEEEVNIIGANVLGGDYASWAYFESVNTTANTDFVARFKKKYGKDRVTSDPLEAAYFGVKLWAEAVKKAKTSQVKHIQKMIKGIGLGGDAPEGIVHIDPDNNHTWKMVRIGKIKNDGQFDIIWNSHKAIRPEPYPLQGKKNWESFLEKLYEGWNKKWSAE